jgi:hypothetical protein
MKTIMKHNIPPATGHYELELPKYSDVVAFVCRRGNFEIHAIYDSNESTEFSKREFVLVKVDEPIDVDGQLVYVGNATNGVVVSHLFEVIL